MGMTGKDLAGIKTALVCVGDGRGFVVEAGQRRLVITAAHCLPFLPPAHPASYEEERTYPKLLSPLGAARRSVSATCWFVDPIADVAVLCCPDAQIVPAEADGYDELTDVAPMRVGPFSTSNSAWLLALDGTWERCSVESRGWSGVWLSISEASEPATAPGTSGSPIVSDAGFAIGVISTGGPMNPALANALPGRLLTELEGANVASRSGRSR